MVKTFDLEFDNTSDHVPIQLNVSYSSRLLMNKIINVLIVCKTLKTGLVLPLLKGKGAKANNKGNYRGITLFPTLSKIYEMIILNR